jgi:hypothetical protein
MYEVLSDSPLMRIGCGWVTPALLARASHVEVSQLLLPDPCAETVDIEFVSLWEPVDFCIQQ